MEPATVKLGVIARMSNRGLGLQTRDLVAHLEPERVLVLSLGPQRDPYDEHPEWYPGATFTTPEAMPEAAPAWLRGLDVVLTVETPYWFGLYDRARELGVRSVLLANPEFFPYVTMKDNLPWPDAVWNPTHWRNDVVGGEVVRQPVDRERFPPRLVERVETLVHVGGHRALGDRNGTQLVTIALRYVTEPCRVIVRSQSAIPNSWTRRVPSHVELELAIGDAPTAEALYEGADALVLPRRYGGNCLPLYEAMSLGLPIVTSGMEPQASWLPPEAQVLVRRVNDLPTQGGLVPMADMDPRDIAVAIDALVADPARAERLSRASDEAAEAIGWERQLPLWREALARVAHGVG